MKPASTNTMSIGTDGKNSPSRNLFLGVTAAIASICLFTSMDATIKWLGADYPVHQLMFFRTTVALIPLLILLWRAGGLGVLKTTRPGLHGLRSGIGMLAMFCAFYGFTVLPLADASAVFYMAPLFATALSVPILKERVGIRRWVALSVGLVGVMVIIRPSGNVFNLGGLSMLCAALLVGLSSTIVRKLNATDPAISITFYFTLCGAMVTSGACMTLGWVETDMNDWPLLVGIGLLGGCAQYTMTLSLRFAELGVIAPFKYFSMILGTVFGYVLWSELPDYVTVMGILIIMAGGIYSIHREAGLARAQDEQHRIRVFQGMQV